MTGWLDKLNLRPQERRWVVMAAAMEKERSNRLNLFAVKSWIACERALGNMENAYNDRRHSRPLVSAPRGKNRAAMCANPTQPG